MGARAGAGATDVLGTGVLELAEAGTPATNWKFLCPYAKCEILKHERSVIRAGADHAVWFHMVLALVLGDSVTVSVVVVGGSQTVTVVGDGVTVAVTVMKSVSVDAGARLEVVEGG